MASATANSVIADAAIVTFYPEVASIETFLGTLAALGRKKFTLVLEDSDHGCAIESYLLTELTGLGYRIVRKSEYIVISF